MSDEISHPPAVAPTLLTLQETAERLRKSYCWLSRNWRRLGLQPTMMGRTLLFAHQDIEAVLEGFRVRIAARRGRPRKVGFRLGLPIDGAGGNS